MKQFLIFKSQEKKNEKSPDFDLRANIDGKFVSIGGGWNRKTKQGTPFISCQLAKPYQDRKGWELRPEALKNESNEDATFKERDEIFNSM